MRKSTNTPDGLIITERKAIYIESKKESVVPPTQESDYRKILDIKNADTFVRHIYWEDIYSSLEPNKVAEKGRIDKRTDFLLNQFREYLEIVRLVGFTGINEVHFNLIKDLDGLQAEPDLPLAKTLWEAGKTRLSWLFDVYGESVCECMGGGWFSTGDITGDNPFPWLSVAESDRLLDSNRAHISTTLFPRGVSVYISFPKGNVWHALIKVLKNRRKEAANVLEPLQRNGYWLTAYRKKKGSRGFTSYKWIHPPVIPKPGRGQPDDIDSFLHEWEAEFGTRLTGPRGVNLEKCFPKNYVISKDFLFPREVAKCFKELRDFRDLVNTAI